MALPFYFEALDAATAQLQSEHGADVQILPSPSSHLSPSPSKPKPKPKPKPLPGADVQIQLVGHSIGGWIARAYLGQLTAERRAAYST